MRIPFFILLILLLGQALVQSQPVGIDLEDPGVEEAAQVDTSAMSIRSRLFPDSVHLLKNPFVPGDQGVIASCSAWALRHLVMLQRMLERKKQVDFSASFLFNLLVAQGEDCEKGARLSSVLDLLRNTGICPTEHFANSQVDCQPLPTEEHKSKAASFRIRDYQRTFTASADSATKVNMTRFVLTFNHPAAVAMSVTAEFEKYRCMATWEPRGDLLSKWGHALVVVGYVDNLKRKGAGYFELMNSYGAGCGRNGLVRVSYAQFARLAKFGFIIFI